MDYNDLPPELIAQVLDNLAGDCHALLACSLISWAWRPHSLSRIFHTIRVPYRAGSGPLSVNPEDFYGIQKQAPDLLLHLRHLIIWTDTSFNYGPTAEQRFLRNVSLIVDYPLTTLTIGSSLDGDWSDGLIDDLGVRIPSLRKLEIDIRGFFPLHDLAKALSSGAHVLVVHAPSPSCRSALEYDSPALASDAALVIPHLQRLELVNTTRQVNERAFAQVARIHVRAPNLRNVVVGGVSHHVLERFCAASHPFRDSIRELSLRTAHSLTQAHLDALLQHCPNLRILEIGVMQEGKSSKAPQPLPAPSSRTPVRLETVRIVYSGLCKLRPDIRSPDAWDTLGAQIYSVVLEFVVADGREEDWRARLGPLVKGFLPRTVSSGRLVWSVEVGRHAPL